MRRGWTDPLARSTVPAGRPSMVMLQLAATGPPRRHDRDADALERERRAGVRSTRRARALARRGGAAHGAPGTLPADLGARRVTHEQPRGQDARGRRVARAIDGPDPIAARAALAQRRARGGQAGATREPLPARASAAAARRSRHRSRRRSRTTRRGMVRHHRRRRRQSGRTTRGQGDPMRGATRSTRRVTNGSSGWCPRRPRQAPRGGRLRRRRWRRTGRSAPRRPLRPVSESGSLTVTPAGRSDNVRSTAPDRSPTRWSSKGRDRWSVAGPDVEHRRDPARRRAPRWSR